MDDAMRAQSAGAPQQAAELGQISVELAQTCSTPDFGRSNRVLDVGPSAIEFGP